MKINNNTIELVGYGHPDRFADYIAECILTEHLKQDKEAKVAVEILATRKSISLGGEITSKAKIDYEKIVYDAIEKVYGKKWWPNFNNVKVYNHIEQQSLELTKIQENKKIVAGDQGVVYGYFNKERFKTIDILYTLLEKVKNNFDIASDWKLLYTKKENELSLSVCGDVNHLEIKKFIKSNNNLNLKKIIVNPKGKWLTPGPLSDTGVVGRKLMIDTFGAGVPHGGGAFCGKDPSKVDKTGIIIATNLAKELAGEFKNNFDVIVELNYKIGDEKPKAFIYLNNFENDISDKIKLTLDEYIKKYDLLSEEWDKHVLNGGVLSYLKKQWNK